MHQSCQAGEAENDFESGGTASRNSLLVAMGACVPNAPTPDVSLSEHGAVNSFGLEMGAGEEALAEAGRIFCVSDLHTDHQANMEWCRKLRANGSFGGDALIVAGDVTSSLVLLEETLQILVGAFAKVFYVPGNHDVWAKGRLAGGLHIRHKPIDSMQKLGEVLALCSRLSVLTAPAYAAGAIIAPLFSWYHSSWDTEPDVIGWEGIPPGEMVMSDCRMCAWPSPLTHADESIARRFDAMNDEEEPLMSRIDSLRSTHPKAPLISFSHFVPRVELNPEKRSGPARESNRDPACRGRG